MKRAAAVLLAGAVIFSVSAVTLEKNAAIWTVKSSGYTANFEKKEGFRPKFIKLNGKNVPYSTAAPLIYLNGEREKWDGQYSANEDPMVFRSSLNVTPEVVSESSDKLVLRFSYPFQFGKIVETVTMDNSDLIGFDVRIDHSQRLGKHHLETQLNWHNADGAVFYPDRKRVSGVWTAHGGIAEGSAWRYAWFGKDKVGFGVIAPEQKHLGGVEYSMQRRKDGWQSNQANMRIVFSPLGQAGKSGSLNFRYYLIAGANPEKAQALAESVLGKDRKIGFFSYETEKLVIRPGQTNRIFAELRNTTGKSADLTLKTAIIYGLNTEKEIDRRKVSLSAGEFRKLEIPLSFPKEAERGVAIRTELFDSTGKLIEKKLDFCSITNYAPRDTGFGIINVGQAFQHGAQDAWNSIFKRNYVGAYEYYCWTPSVIFGLAPEIDSWIPQTEHNYRSVITKAFLKELISNAHSKGVGVYAWISGLWSYKEALQRPEWVQYTQNGQPNIYSGRVYADGSRRIVVKANMFYPDRAALWGKEMADSVDMFGWDGCRWDWAFIPAAMCDPLYQGDSADEWYDHRGIPQSKLFPEPDKISVECLKAWRNAVESRHPDFIYGTNYSSGPDAWKSYPGYHKEAARNGLVLFEDMLGYRLEHWNTFEKWGTELAARCDLVRPYNAAPVVGAMSGLPMNSVSYHLANYTAASSGVKWWAYGNSYIHERSPERNRYLLRFARYYFGTEFLRPEKSPVELTAPAKVLFKPFVRERKTAEGREIVVPLVNMPEENNYVCEFHMEPPVRKICLKLTVKPGENVTAWLMTPQSPEKAVQIPVKNGVVTIPALKDAAMVLFQCKGGK